MNTACTFESLLWGKSEQSTPIILCVQAYTFPRVNLVFSASKGRDFSYFTQSKSQGKRVRIHALCVQAQGLKFGLGLQCWRGPWLSVLNMTKTEQKECVQVRVLHACHLTTHGPPSYGPDSWCQKGAWFPAFDRIGRKPALESSRACTHDCAVSGWTKTKNVAYFLHSCTYEQKQLHWTTVAEGQMNGLPLCSSRHSLAFDDIRVASQSPKALILDPFLRGTEEESQPEHLDCLWRTKSFNSASFEQARAHEQYSSHLSRLQEPGHSVAWPLCASKGMMVDLIPF